MQNEIIAEQNSPLGDNAINTVYLSINFTIGTVFQISDFA